MSEAQKARTCGCTVQPPPPQPPMNLSLDYGDLDWCKRVKYHRDYQHVKLKGLHSQPEKKANLHYAMAGIRGQSFSSSFVNDHRPQNWPLLSFLVHAGLFRCFHSPEKQ